MSLKRILVLVSCDICGRKYVARRVLLVQNGGIHWFTVCLRCAPALASELTAIADKQEQKP